MAASERAVGRRLAGTGVEPRKLLAVGGKTLCGVDGEGLPGEHLVSAYTHQTGMVLAQVRRLLADCPEQKQLAYLGKRQEHMAYPAYRAGGLSIGDGAVESGNKLVVEARLKGSGRHWARPPVRPAAGPAQRGVQ